MAQAWSLVRAVAAEFAKAVAAERRYERLKWLALGRDDPAVSVARRIYIEFYSDTQSVDRCGVPQRPPAERL
jgi:hypothetical protein